MRTQRGKDRRSDGLCTAIFLTHLHNDHYEGLSNLWLTPWFLLSRAENRKAGYAGPLTMGYDRMVVTVSDKVQVYPPRPLRDLPDLDR